MLNLGLGPFTFEKSFETAGEEPIPFFSIDLLALNAFY
jgi:hypothetical protein